MNSNAFHNIVNIVIAALAGLTAILMATGCVEVAGALSCSGSWLSPKVAALAITALAVLKVAVNVFRDGFGGMFKPQPPVQ